MSIAESPSIRLNANSNGMELEPDEFDAVTEWDPAYRYELIHGVVIVSPIPAEGEAAPVDELGYLLRKYQEKHPQGAALDWSLPERYIYLSNKTRRRADRVIWAGLGRMPRPKLDPPAIAIEFVSKSRRDRQRDYVTKRREYREAGVKEYWLIARFRRVMSVSLADGSERELTENEIYQTPLLPGFELSLQRLLAVADKWK
jgi:Uma2 family endonuclease